MRFSDIVVTCDPIVTYQTARIDPKCRFPLVTRRQVCDSVHARCSNEQADFLQDDPRETLGTALDEPVRESNHERRRPRRPAPVE